MATYMETRKFIKVIAGEYSPSFGMVEAEENGVFVCRLSGGHFSKGSLKVSQEQTTVVENAEEGAARFTIDNLVWWLRSKVTDAHAKGIIVGISGGIDSSVVAALAKLAFPDNCFGVIMPIHSNPDDLMYGEMLCKAIGMDYTIMDLSKTFDTLKETAREANYVSENADKLVGGNLKARLRMATLYYGGQERGYLVVGTGNAAETVTGYFTKYGDSGSDLLPLSKFLKRQVREIARYLNVPEPIITKPPSAGLYEGQTDEGEMGLLYKDIDDYLAGLKVPAAAKEKIEQMRERSEHKRHVPPSFPQEMIALSMK